MRELREVICSHQLVLIGRHGREDCFRKDEGSVFLILHVTNWATLPFCSLHKINPGLELVHGVQDDLKQRKLCNLSDRLARVQTRNDVFSDQISWGINLPNWGRAVRIVTRYEKLRGKC